MAAAALAYAAPAVAQPKYNRKTVDIKVQQTEATKKLEARKSEREKAVPELTELRRDILKVKIEIGNAKIGQKRAELQKQEIFGTNREEAIIVDDEHQTWSFNGEYWKDELGFYRFRISSKCARK